MIDSPFYNTTGERDPELSEYREQAKSQDETILEFFECYHALSFTPFEIQAAVMIEAPITSVRRSITNLTTAGKLRRTDEKREGDYGRPCYCWTIAYEPAPVQDELF